MLVERLIAIALKLGEKSEAFYHTLSRFEVLFVPSLKMRSEGRNALSSRQLKVVYAHDLRGNLTFLNRAGQQLSGYTFEEARRLNIVQLIAPEMAEFFREEIIGEAGRQIGHVYEVEMVAKNGRRVPLELSTRMVLREGRPVEIEGVAFLSVTFAHVYPGRAPKSSAPNSDAAP